MTLIIDVQTPNFSLTVSDRVVSAGGKPVYSRFNKAIFLLCFDGILTISFTGNAIIQGLPTDEWIARKLLRIDRDEVYLSRFNSPPCGPRTIEGAKVAVLKAFLGLGQRRGHSGIFLDVLFSGLRLTRRHVFPFRDCIEVRPQSPQIRVTGRPKKSVYLSQSGASLDVSGGWDRTRPDLVNELARNLLPSLSDVSACIEACLSTLAKFAKDHPSIGSEAMSSVARIDEDSHISFWPLRELAAEQLIPGVDDFKGRISYCPWIISPTSFMASMKYSGGFSFQSGKRSDGTAIKVQVATTASDKTEECFFLYPQKNL